MLIDEDGRKREEERSLKKKRNKGRINPKVLPSGIIPHKVAKEY